MIQVLEQHGIHPDFIVGTSAGSIVGSIYASGKTASELRYCFKPMMSAM